MESHNVLNNRNNPNILQAANYYYLSNIYIKDHK